MHSRRATLALTAAFLSLTCAGLSPVHAEVDQTAIAEASLTHVIRPGYAALRDAADSLNAKVAALCQEPSQAALEEAKAAFAETVGAWSKVEIFRFGPMAEQHRYERLFYWPDPKGLGLKQVQDAIAKGDQAVALPDELAEKSVALQGLPALEYLLYGDGAETLAAKGDMGSSGAFRCGFALAVSTNIGRIARNVVEGWREGSAYEKSFLGPAPEDPRYRTSKEVTLELFKAFTSGIELVRDQKLGKPLGAGPEEAKPKLAAFWRSGLAFANAAGNLDGVRALFAQGGFAEIVAGESPGVQDSILFDLGHAIEVLRGIDEPAEQAFRNASSRSALEALRVSLKSARDTASDLIAKGAGLSFGFNAMDGD